MAKYKSPQKKARDKADKLCGQIVRSRGACEMAGKDSIECNGVLQWCHIIGRSNYRLRWEEQNSLCMCAAHHVYYTFNTWVWQEIIREQFPENYDFIEAHRLEQFDKDYSSLIERLETRWNQLQNS